ncbi:hypothetical protein A3C32_00825 [Candidatus Daviesbacteria bacterium RIFCSPHIGHO2_02_FULL_41_14]|uniref:Uncharacterized protein n=1 Tax=Candidatus Daviesbacteria bacterium RIFCSPLOWO2_01_FULL_40_24 TaxID=1797787 RepID=A0A1F5MKA4_9BACT|nr:MAG: hypothetical protein A2780_01830 [Candidatus Daviesbacteria bacterium RIFCSPHIGHO2_01_FULL_41_45]OGE34122.1 MAG: hypothetical protein A3C32_00825 [Candidatus Daviesbacteria bacterium RIFCSPHIGHO2_02_FULL_41_14]OGE65804.1 MAG: hypothetical protein A3B49_03330 [Candidatus Daviesbacteria bacterium RIFCSPLOWO2_01_FULL_40_24]
MPAQRLVFCVLYLVFAVVVLFASVTPVYAQQPTPTGSPLTSTNFDYFKHGQTTIEGSMGHTILCSLAGFSLYGQCVGYEYKKEDNKPPAIKPLVYDQLPNGGALGMLGTTTMALYTPPTSATLYLANLGESIGLSPKSALAQNVAGSGAGIIQPVIQLWQVIRNLAYLAFILVFLSVGFMIMFRSKINPQTVISVQAALPGLVIGLILITFSYFIAALIIDLAFVGVQLSAQIFKTSGLANNMGDLDQLSQNSNIFQLFLNAGVNNIGTIFNATNTQFTGTLESIHPGATTGLPAIIGALVGGLMFMPAWPFIVGGFAAGASLQFLIPIIVIAVVLIALFVQLFKLVFALITTYIQLLVFTMAGPLFILYGSIPGRGGAISFWFRGLMANSLIFPTVFMVFLFAGAMLGNDTKVTASLPLLGGLNGNFIKVLIAFGLILGTPAIPDIIRGLFKVQLAPQIMKEALGGASAGIDALKTGYGKATAPAAHAQEAYEKAKLEHKVHDVSPSAAAGGKLTGTEALIMKIPIIGKH